MAQYHGESLAERARDSQTLRVYKIPQHVSNNDIQIHFAQFGPVVAMEQDKFHQKDKGRMVRIQFYTKESAEKARRSPLSVCNNRFIKVDAAFQNLVDPAEVPPPPVEDMAGGAGRRGGGPGPGGVSPGRRRGTREPMSREEVEAKSGAEQLEEKRRKAKELQEKKAEIVRKRRDALNKQLAESNKMLSKLRTKKGAETLVQGLEQTIAELENLLAAPENLEVQVSKAPKKGGNRGRGARHRGSNTIDNRTTVFRVAEVPEGVSQDQLQAHFGAFAPVEEVTLEPATNEEGEDVMSALVRFSDRAGAEVASRRGRFINGSPLQLSWHRKVPARKKTAEHGSAQDGSGSGPGDALLRESSQGGGAEAEEGGEEEEEEEVLIEFEEDDEDEAVIYD